MKLGIRCFPDKLAYVVADGSRRNPVLIEADVRKFPKDLTRAGFLNWVSKEIKGILLRHPIKGAAFKEIEATARKNNLSLRRAELEGVIQAVLYENGCREVEGLNKQQLKSALGFDGAAKDITGALKDSKFEEFVGKDQEDAALAAWSLLRG